MDSSQAQYKRRVRLTVVGVDDEIDLSSLRIRFIVKAIDAESPNNAFIRVYNLSEETEAQIKEEYREVVLEAGYENQIGVIFKGTIKQYHSGKENATDTFLDLLAADGDLAYNEAFINEVMEAGTTTREALTAIGETLQEKGVTGINLESMPMTGGTKPRGKVLFGMSRVAARRVAEDAGATWSIQQGEMIVVPKEGFLVGEAIVLNGQSGLIGRPEQTIDGIMAKCLINSTIKVAGLVKIDNAAINSTTQALGNGANLVYNQYAGLQFLASVASDGLYRVYVIEYEGDTRGTAWYATLTLLTVDPSENLVLVE